MKSIVHLGGVIVLAAALLAYPPQVHAAGTVITVTSTADDASMATLNGNTTCDLREAIEAANTNTIVGQCLAGSSTATDVDTIKFGIPGTGRKTIHLATDLQAVTSRVLLDGTTQSGWSSSSGPLVNIDADGLTGSAMLTFADGSDGSTIRGLMLTNAKWINVFIGSGAEGITVRGNYFTTDGTSQIPTTFSGAAGVEIFRAKNTVIGGTTLGQRNIFSGNTGVQIDGGSNNRIQGNYFGVRADGITPITNQTVNSAAIFLEYNSMAPSGNIIQNNVIGGFQSGISLNTQVTQTTITGNKIGVGADGATNVGMGQGIELHGSSFNTIGGATAAERNIISGSNVSQIYIENLSPYSSDSNLIQGNYIGTDATGESAVDPLTNATGIYIAGGAGNVIGGSGAGQGNLISGLHGGYGINLQSASTSGTIIRGNTIGTNKEGTVALANDMGIFVSDNPANIGDGTTPGRNLISGNTTAGIYVMNSGAAGTTIVGNKIGVRASSGAAPTGAATDTAIRLDSSASAQIAQNWIANSTSYSVLLTTPSTVLAGSTNNCFSNNGTFGLTNVPATIAPFDHNWWGDKSGPTDPTGGNPGGTGDKVAPNSGNIDYSSYLTVPPATCSLQWLKNAGFETDANNDKKPDNWTFAGFNTATDKRDCSVHQAGACSLKLVGNGMTKTASETIMKSGLGGDDFTMTLWSKASNVPAGAIYRVQVQIYSGSTLLTTKTRNFTVGLHSFQPASLSFTAPGAYTKVVYKLTFKAASGTAWFDTAALKWAP